MNSGWLVLSLPFVAGAVAWLARSVATRLALRRLKAVTGHRLQLERCWQLIGQVPPTLLSADTRRALGRVLAHHLSRSRRAGANETGQELRIAQFVGHSVSVSLSYRPNENLAKALGQLIGLLDAALAARILPVSLHVRAHDHLAAHLATVENALQQRNDYVARLLHTPFGARAPART